MDPFPHMAAAAGHQAAEAARPAKLISGSRRHMHAHVRGRQEPEAVEPSSSGQSSAMAAEPPMPWSSTRTTGPMAGPPGMPWMAAHSSAAPYPPPPPAPPEEHAYAYAEPVPADKCGGSLNSYHYKPLQQPGRHPKPSQTWQPPAPAARPACRASETAAQANCLRPESRSGPAPSAPSQFHDDQTRLQEELTRMKVQNELKREATAAKVKTAKQKADEAVASRMKAREEEQRRRQAEQSERIRQMEEAVRRAQEESRREEEKERLARQQQRHQQQQQQPARPFAHHSNPKQAQEDDFKKRQAAAEARRQREAAANGAKARPRQARRPAASAAALFQRHEASWEQFERMLPAQVSMASIPWPPAGEDPLRGAVAVAMGAGAEDENQEIKSQYRRLAMRWHPDKFLAKFGSTLVAQEKDAILERVKNTQQAVNQTYNLLKP